MKQIRYILYIIGYVLSLIACSGSEKDLTPRTEAESLSVEVPVTVELESAWNVDAETGSSPRLVPPPGADSYYGSESSTTISEGWVNAESDISGVDKVRVVAFRRKDTSDGTGTSAPFIYDSRNDQTVNVIDWKNVDSHDGELPAAHRHRYATATLNKVFGYEYRVVAIAYNSMRTVPYAASGSYNNVLTAGEHNWFTLNVADGLTLDGFMATIKTQTVEDNSTGWREYLTGNDGAIGTTEHTSNLTAKVMACPQLFWGYCHIGDKNPVIRFQTTNGSGNLVDDAPLTGLLYRGMAKIELHINLQGRNKGVGTQNVDWLALMADHVQTQTLLSDYDDFLSPTVAVETDGKFTAIDFITSSSAGTKVLTAWILPTRTRLAIRGKYELSLGAHRVENGQLCASDISYSDMGTGIISADVVDNYFTFRRNHKYVLNCSSSENIFNNHEID